MVSVEKESIVEKKWKVFGLDCKVIFVRQTHRCGYCAVPEGHVAFDKDYNDLPIDVHGGLTYGQIGGDGQMWFGFDCAHPGDKILNMSAIGDHFWTLEEVVEETENMAKQFAELKLRDIIIYKIQWEPDWFKDNIKIMV